MSVAEQRDRLVRIAMTWERTPYHHAARVKGVGVDCAMLLLAVGQEAGIVPDVEVASYSHQWHLNRSDEVYLEFVLRYMHEVSGPPLPGDIVLWRFGRCFSHGAIVIDWPTVLHARVGRNCHLEDAERCAWLRQIGESRTDQGAVRPRKFFSYWAE